MRREITFSEIFNEFSPKIRRYLTRLIGENEADDFTQIVFEKVNRNLSGFKGESKLSTWIYKIATNTALDHLKSASYLRAVTGPLAPMPTEIVRYEELADDLKAKQTSAEQGLIRDEMSECIKEFVYRLPPDYSTIIILNELEGFTNKEIAEILQISLDTVKIRLHRARAKLRKSLQTGCDFYQDDRSELACDRKQPLKEN
jgi:RNA polymerase sigma-70 factor (ECF subfamily)